MKSNVMKAMRTMGDKPFTRQELMDVSGASSGCVGSICNKMIAEGSLVQRKNGKKIVYSFVGDHPVQREDTTSNLPINDRFRYIEKFTKMVALGHSPSFLLTGQGGVGKTFAVTKTLEGLGLQEGDDYVVIKGYSSPMGLYRALYHNQDKLILLDDCDSCLKDSVSLNLLKAALDSYDKRIVSWNSVAAERMDMETEFEFTGSVIFISNMDYEKLDGAVVSRTITANLRMSPLEILERIEAIANDLLPNVSMEKKLEVLEFMKENAGHFKSLNFRTFIQAGMIRNAEDEDWREMVLYTL
jgi:hypothetical protein